MAQSKRIRFISFLQILGVILVILGHSLHEYPGDFHQFWFYRMFQTVRMPLFVFISGYLFMISMVKREYNVSLVDFIKNKAQRLLVPYFVLTILTFVPRALMSEYADEPVKMDINSFISSIFFSDKLTIVFLWFLPVVFVLLCVSFIGIKLFKNRLSLFFLIGGILSIAGYFCVNQWEWTFM
uniref:acyltransferase family protein n=2 Tax=Bacteroidales TaxID=171549 RepID=UPI0025B00928